MKDFFVDPALVRKFKALCGAVDGLLVALLVCFLIAVGGARASTITAYLVDEEDLEGRFKLCVYEAHGDQYLVTIDDVELCPLSIEIEP